MLQRWQQREGWGASHDPHQTICQPSSQSVGLHQSSGSSRRTKHCQHGQSTHRRSHQGKKGERVMQYTIYKSDITWLWRVAVCISGQWSNLHGSWLVRDDAETAAYEWVQGQTTS